MAINHTDISVVVQGPVLGDGVTAKCLESIRRHLPGAEIILSTWQGTDTSGLCYDLLVENEDPGALVFHRRLPNLYNLNRQILSTREGLHQATRAYAIKTRSDLFFTGTGFLDYWQRYSCRDDAMRIFNERLVNCTVFAQNPHRHQPTPFHPGDWFFFGYRDDLLTLWDIPLAPEPETSRWFCDHPRPQPDMYPHLLHRYFPEQYIWFSLLRKHGDYSFEHQWDLSEQNLELTERSFASNLIFLEPEKIGICSLKHRLTLDDWGGIYSHSEWEQLYRRYCDPLFKVSFAPEVVAKNMYQVCRFLSPKRLSDHLLSGLLNEDTTLLDRWEKTSPRTFNFARTLHRLLG
jgi:hypothetical protein